MSRSSNKPPGHAATNVLKTCSLKADHFQVTSLWSLSNARSKSTLFMCSRINMQNTQRSRGRFRLFFFLCITQVIDLYPVIHYLKFGHETKRKCQWRTNKSVFPSKEPKTKDRFTLLTFVGAKRFWACLIFFQFRARQFMQNK